MNYKGSLSGNRSLTRTQSRQESPKSDASSSLLHVNESHASNMQYQHSKMQFQLQTEKALNYLRKTREYQMGKDAGPPPPKKKSLKKKQKGKQKKLVEQPHDELESVMNKYDYLNLPKNVSMRRRLFRPEIYLHLAVKNLCALGFFVIELYTEAAPQVVIEFMRTCAARKKARIQMKRLFPQMWIEGELKTDANSNLSSRLEYDETYRNHNLHFGDLSFPESCLNGFEDGYINFAINFKPLHVLNNRRVIFGRLIMGRKLLETISEFGTKEGKPMRELVIKDCGIMY